MSFLMFCKILIALKIEFLNLTIIIKCIHSFTIIKDSGVRVAIVLQYIRTIQVMWLGKQQNHFVSMKNSTIAKDESGAKYH
jgi:hypothetical protein